MVKDKSFLRSMKLLDSFSVYAARPVVEVILLFLPGWSNVNAACDSTDSFFRLLFGSQILLIFIQCQAILNFYKAVNNNLLCELGITSWQFTKGLINLFSLWRVCLVRNLIPLVCYQSSAVWWVLCKSRI